MAKSPYPRSDLELLRKVERSPGGKAGYKQLVREFGLGGGRERRLLLEQLTRLVARGALAQADRDSWKLPPPRHHDDTDGSQARSRNSSSNVADPLRSGRDRLVSGRLDLHRDGFGFVRPEAGSSESRAGSADIFIPPNEIHGAMQGDLVLVEENPPGPGSSRDGRRSGRIARVLTRRNPTVVGIFHYARPVHRASGESSFAPARGNFIVPIDERLGNAIEIPDGAELVAPQADSPHRTVGGEARVQGDSAGSRASARVQDSRWPLQGLAVNVELTSFPQPGRPARGRVIEVLGHPDDFGVDVEIIIRKHAIPHVFSPPVLAEATDRATEIVSALGAGELAEREDFRGLPIVTIDGETARDFDDAVLVRLLPDGMTELQVHIADVSWYVRPESALDTEARVRGTSVYFPDRAVPMLPHALSSGMCSLLPDEDRLTLSCIMQIDGEGEIAGFRVAESIIRSARRMTYTAVGHCLNASPRAAEWNRGASVTPAPDADDFAERERLALEQPELPEAFDAMLQLALKLNAKRQRRGSIDFDLPEPVVEFDPDGNMKAIVRSERGWAHRLIEEFMLSANECVATWLRQADIPSIYRIHEMPDPKRIVEFEETAAGFGQTLGIGSLPVRKFTTKGDRRDAQRRSGRETSRSAKAQQHEIPERIDVTPQMYQRLVRRISGHPEERILAYLMLRSLKQARYAEANEGHFALASPNYTHFTSPIRRYPDLIVHRLVRAMLRSGADPTGGAIRSTDPQPWSEARDRHSTVESTQQRSSHSPDRDRVPPIPAEELNDIAVESSQAERRAADAERELIEWKKMKFMADKVGDDFPGVILSVTKYGFFVELDEMFIEGLVPISSLSGDFYTFRDTDRSICGARTGHCFRIGDRAEVILDRIDRQQRRLQFALLPGTEPKANTGGSHSGEGHQETRPKSKGTKRKESGRKRKAR